MKPQNQAKLDAILQSDPGAIIEVTDGTWIIKSGHPTIMVGRSSQVTVKTWGNSQVTVETRGNSQATVETRGNSQATVKTWGNSQVKTWESSQATVETRESSQARISAWDYSVCVIEGKSKNKHGSKAKIIIGKIGYPSSIREWATMKGIKIEHGAMNLWKCVRSDGTDFKTGKINYLDLAVALDWDVEYKDECGSGLHLADSPSGAQIFIPDEFSSNFRLIQVSVAIKDCRCFPGRPEYPMKLRARACKFVKEFPANYQGE